MIIEDSCQYNHNGNNNEFNSIYGWILGVKPQKLELWSCMCHRHTFTWHMSVYVLPQALCLLYFVFLYKAVDLRIDFPLAIFCHKCHWFLHQQSHFLQWSVTPAMDLEYK